MWPTCVNGLLRNAKPGGGVTIDDLAQRATDRAAPSLWVGRRGADASRFRSRLNGALPRQRAKRL